MDNCQYLKQLFCVEDPEPARCSRQERGLTVFARIDFSCDAEKADLKMKQSQLLIFGNPRAGIPLMIASPTIANLLTVKGSRMGRPERKGLALLQTIPNISRNAREYLMNWQKTSRE